jgi:Na+/glutamate symporter
MTYEIFFAGVGGTVFGSLIGAYIASRLTYEFQKQLLKQQLDFQKEQSEADAVLRKQIKDEVIKTIEELRETLRVKIGSVVTQLSSLSVNLNNDGK